MPIHTNSIGSFTFNDLIGTIFPRRKRIELFERPGVEGHGARNMKRAGKPFELISLSFVDTFAVAATTHADYLDEVGEIVTLTRNSVNYGQYLIVDCEEHSPPKAVSNVISNGAVTGDEVLQIMRWTLVWKADPS